MQLRFPFADLVCAWNEDWLGPHPLCQQYAERLQGEFRDAVARGEYDEFGYRPSDRRKARRMVA